MKVRVEQEFHLDSGDFSKEYHWTKKIPLFEHGLFNGQQLECSQELLLNIIKRDYIKQEFGFNVLECADIIVFRENVQGEHEFLLLHRNEAPHDTGWEYPKGGLFYHETPHEGAVRELLEETGVRSIGDFRFGGDLGFQTPDVINRGKGYSHLRVHGLAYYYSGTDSVIADFLQTKRSGEHDRFMWKPFHKAKEVWMKEQNYGSRFFERWQEQRFNIIRRISPPLSIAYELIEECPHTCRFCHRRIAKEPALEIPGILEIIDTVASRGILRLTFTGGEPLNLGKDKLFHIIEYANKKHLHTCLSTTGIGKAERLTKTDLVVLDRILDHMLLPCHCVNKQYARLLYRKDTDWIQITNQIGSILEWVKSTSIIPEICTIVCRPNKAHIVEIGEWIFKKLPNCFWRVDEYYANGTQDSLQARFSLEKGEFEELKEQIIGNGNFQEPLANDRIWFSNMVGRFNAPDVMLTPQGNIVTSSQNTYIDKGTSNMLLALDIKNRRSWSNYRRCCRMDWDWARY